MVWYTPEEAHACASVEELMRYTGCSLSTAKRWKAKPDTMPESARRLASYHVCNDLSVIWGKDWAHFQFVAGTLVAPGWRRGFGPHEIKAMFFRVQMVSSLEAEARQLRRDLERERERCEALERSNYFYREQVKQAARFGLMFERVFG